VRHSELRAELRRSLARNVFLLSEDSAWRERQIIEDGAILPKVVALEDKADALAKSANVSRAEGPAIYVGHNPHPICRLGHDAQLADVAQRASRGELEQVQTAQQSRLSRSARTNDTEDLAFLKLEAYIAKDDVPAEVLLERIRADNKVGLRHRTS
jgi:hypothetical protein